MSHAYTRSRQGEQPLTTAQVSDCYRAGRSPNSGRLFRGSSPSVAEKSAREMNWRKLLVKGAIANLRMVARAVGAFEALGILTDLENCLLEKSKRRHELNKQQAKAATVQPNENTPWS
ncbi:hypothetical protein D3C81_365330 [compost metagenome]